MSSPAYTELGAIAGEWLEEARDTFRGLTMLVDRLRLRRRVATLEGNVAELLRAARTLDRVNEAQAKELGRLNVDLDELVGVVAALMPWAKDAELDGLLATDNRGARRRALEEATELRRRIHAAAAARDVGQARQAVALMLGWQAASSSDDPPPADALEYALTDLEATPPATRLRLVVPDLEFDEEATAGNVVSYLRDRLADEVDADD